ncbi:MAG TPA: hypothetical protein VFE96_04600 [Candidatus Bathyarchaeia archaeon]|nr:hypothetical protein [Candidatus Bathyarchaeia archaeon]
MLVVATVKYDICSNTVAPLSTSVFTVVGVSDSLSVNTTLPPWAPAIATTVFPALTLVAVVVATRAPPVAVLDVRKLMPAACTGLTNPTRRNSTIRQPNSSLLRCFTISTRPSAGENRLMVTIPHAR